MKKTILLITLALALFSSCSKQFIQVFDTSTTNTKLTDGFWVYETDSIKLTYSFWADKGVMSFSVYNKLNKPIYIDWKNSSFIYNSDKLDYWIDELQSKGESYYGGYYYNGPALMPGLSVKKGVSASTSKTIKPERVTFIPPKSKSYRYQFYLMPVNYYKMDSKKTIETTVPRNHKPVSIFEGKNATVYEEKFDYSSTPLKFRNYLAFSFSENSTGNYFFVDNEFYLTSVKKMDLLHWQGEAVKDEEGNWGYVYPFKNGTSFYIKIPLPNGVE